MEKERHLGRRDVRERDCMATATRERSSQHALSICRLSNSGRSPSTMFCVRKQSEGQHVPSHPPFSVSDDTRENSPPLRLRVLSGYATMVMERRQGL